MRVVELVQASGHPKVKARHKMTLEITKDAHLTERGDCIVATAASKGAADLSPEFSKLIKHDSALVTLTIRIGKLGETITGRGDGRLTLRHPTDLVTRKSNYVCARTIMVCADKAASDLNRNLIRALRDPSSTVTIEIIAELRDAQFSLSR